MREELLHFVWKYRKLPSGGLSTTSGKVLRILHNGLHNAHSGPDFFNARLEIGGQLWAGNVEVHVKASDWYLHGHQEDPNYRNVILHVVWEDDVPVVDKSGTPIHTLKLKSYVPENLLRSYRKLFSKKRSRFIPCENELKRVDSLLISNWLDRLYIERLEQKSRQIETLLRNSRNDWEHVLFLLLLKNFGLNINGEAFLQVGLAIDFRIIRKIGNDVFRLESLFFGQSGLLDRQIDDSYHRALREEYAYLRRRFRLKQPSQRKPEYAKLRPSNFPSLRLAQFAALCASEPVLFSKVIEATSLNQLYNLFTHSPGRYWCSHFDFGKASRHSAKKISKPFIRLLLVNTVLPVRYCHARLRGTENGYSQLELLSAIPAEKNRLINGFARQGIVAGDARESQALLQLYREYCSRCRCLHCAVGCSLLAGK